MFSLASPLIIVLASSVEYYLSFFGGTHFCRRFYKCSVVSFRRQNWLSTLKLITDFFYLHQYEVLSYSNYRQPNICWCRVQETFRRFLETFTYLSFGWFSSCSPCNLLVCQNINLQSMWRNLIRRPPPSFQVYRLVVCAFLLCSAALLLYIKCYLLYLFLILSLLSCVSFFVVVNLSIRSGYLLIYCHGSKPCTFIRRPLRGF